MADIPADIMERALEAYRDGCLYPANQPVADGPLIRAIALALLAEREAATMKEREACAKACEQVEKEFLEPSYASHPINSFDERFGCSQCAKAIRARGGE